MARRCRPSRAERRRAERARANALARERGAEAAGDVPIHLRIARHRDQLDQLELVGVISGAQARAGHRLARDHQMGGAPVRLRMPAYQPGAPPPRKLSAALAPDSPAALDARERFQAALRAAGEYAAILVHVCLTDLPPAAWQPALGANGHGHAVEQLREGLTRLILHYDRQRPWLNNPEPVLGPARAALEEQAAR
jgi:hypothetical protein